MKLFFTFVLLLVSTSAEFDAFRDVKVWLYRESTFENPLQLELGNVELLLGSGFDIRSNTFVIIDGWFEDAEIDFANRVIRDMIQRHHSRGFMNVRNVSDFYTQN